jgi:rSAM/selenodomain-associated transferase 2
MISIITPILNEEGYVMPFIAHIRDLEGDFELIMVDGGSSDGTLKEVENSMDGHRIKLLRTQRGRAIQMNKGAEAACGDILLFLHVDCFIAKDSLKLIETEIYVEKNIGGGFKQYFSDPDAFLKFVSAFGNLRARFTKIFFGDYGIFLRKDIFERIGSYDNLPFLEDVELCKKAKKYGNLARIDRFIYTSPRRYLSKGRIRLTVVFILAGLFNYAGFRPRFLLKYIIDK